MSPWSQTSSARQVMAGLSADEPREEGLFSGSSADEDDGSILEKRDLVLAELQGIAWELTEWINNERLFLDFVQDEGFEDVVDEMAIFPRDEEIQSIGCMILLHLFRLDPGTDNNGHEVVEVEENNKVKVSIELLHSVVDDLVNAGLPQALAQIVTTFAGNDRLQSQAFALLLRIVKSTRQLTDNECGNRLPQFILWSIGHHLKRNVFLISALNCLVCRLWADKHLLYALVKGGILRVLMSVMLEHRYEAPIQRKVNQLLFLAVDHDEACRLEMIQLGMVPLITRTINEGLDDKQLLLAACGILWHLANEGELAKVLLVKEAGAIQHLVRVLWGHANDWELQAAACGALCSLALSSDPYVMTQLLESGASKALGLSIRLHSKYALVAQPAYVTLSRMEEFSVQLLISNQQQQQQQDWSDPNISTATAMTGWLRKRRRA